MEAGCESPSLQVCRSTGPTRRKWASAARRRACRSAPEVHRAREAAPAEDGDAKTLTRMATAAVPAETAVTALPVEEPEWPAGTRSLGRYTAR